MESKHLLKSFFLFSLLLIVSCSKSDDGASSAASINPPDWIQGTWLSGSSSGFKFTKNDFKTVALNTEISHKQQLDLAMEIGQDASTDEVKTGDTYKLTLNIQGNAFTYEFTKKSESAIVWENHALKPEYERQ